jgi:hypothetical protein
VVAGAIRINGSQISSDDSNAIQIKETLQVDNLSSDDSSALNVTSGMTIAGAVDVNGTLSASTIDVNTIQSEDSAGVVVNDGLSVAGPLNGAGSSVLQITDGIDVEAASTFEGAVTFDSNILANGYLRYSTETVSGDGAGTDAISTSTGVTFLNTSGGTSSLTFADGVSGQVKHIIMTVAGNDATLDNTNLNVSTSIVFNAVGEAATLVFDGTTSKWNIVGVQGATVS